MQTAKESFTSSTESVTQYVREIIIKLMKGQSEEHCPD